MKYFITCLLIFSLFLSACSTTSRVKYDDLIKIVGDSINSPIELDNLFKKIELEFSKVNYTKALTFIDNYIGIDKDANYLNKSEVVEIFAYTYMYTGELGKLDTLIFKIIDLYPTNKNLFKIVFDYSFLSSDIKIHNFIMNSPVLNKQEKSFYEFWWNWNGDVTNINDITNLQKCPKDQDGSIICQLIIKTIDVAREFVKYKDESSEYLYTLLSKLYLENNLRGFAYFISNKGIDLESDYRDGLFIRGLTSFSLGRFDESEQALGKAYAIDSGYKDVFYYYAMSLYKVGNYRKASEIAKLGLDLKYSTLLLRKLVVLSDLKSENYEGLVKFLVTQLNRYPEEFDTDLIVAMTLYMDKKDFDENIVSWKRVVSESDVELFYKVKTKKINHVFFEKNFKSFGDLGFVSRFAWIMSYKDVGLDEMSKNYFDRFRYSEDSELVDELLQRIFE